MRAITFGLLLVLISACSVDPTGPGGPSDPGDDDDGSDVDPSTPGQIDEPDVPAPAGFYPDEVVADDGDNAVEVAAGGTAILRVESTPDQHIGLELSFDPTDGVVMAAERWNGREAVAIGETDAGRGLRFLALRDPARPRTYWIRVVAGEAPLSALLRVTRTPFADGNACTEDCDRLLQLPLPNSPAVDGYATDENVVFRYWFGRRDLIMFLRTAAARQAKAGKAPFVPQDISQWDGETPGTDVGSPRHASHSRGKDVDISIYGTDGQAPWRSFCTTTDDGGRQCVDGTVKDFDGKETAVEVSSFFATGRVTMCFLDQALIGEVVAGSVAAAADGLVDESLLPLYDDGVHIQNWPNHDNHIHIRVSEAEPGSLFIERSFEAP